MGYKIYLKKLGAQELGYRNGKQSTGGYFYISKNAISFFPGLSKKKLNDTVVLEFKVDYRKAPIFINLVYHNDKFCKSSGTRDEYRMYLNRDIAPDDFFFMPNDIIVLHRLQENKYTLEKIREGNDNYNRLIKIILESQLQGNHALVENLP
jgi:hypothetical protein